MITHPESEFGDFPFSKIDYRHKANSDNTIHFVENSTFDFLVMVGGSKDFPLQINVFYKAKRSLEPYVEAWILPQFLRMFFEDRCNREVLAAREHLETSISDSFKSGYYFGREFSDESDTPLKGVSVNLANGSTLHEIGEMDPIVTKREK